MISRDNGFSGIFKSCMTTLLQHVICIGLINLFQDVKLFNFSYPPPNKCLATCRILKGALI